MIFKLSIQYQQWLKQRKPEDKFCWGHTSIHPDAPIETEEKLFKDMDEEEKEAAFRREIYSTIYKYMIIQQ